jgi:hypothetical protein
MTKELKLTPAQEELVSRIRGGSPILPNNVENDKVAQG